MLLTPPLSAAPLHPSLFPTRTHRYVGSAILVVAFFVTLAAVYTLGPRLKRRMNDEAAEATQATLVTLVGALAGAILVIIWRATNEVQRAIDTAILDPTPANGVRILVTILAFAIAYTFSRITKRFVQVGAGRDAITNHQREIIHHVIQIAVFIPAVIFTVGLWQFPVGNVLLAGGAIGVVVGLAARQTLGAILAGFVVLFSAPFRVGDWVEIDEIEGIVTDVSIFNTQVRTFDDELVMIPNDHVTEANIYNRSRSDRLRIKVDVGVDYGADVQHAASVAVDAMAACEEVTDDRDPDVILKEFGDSSVVLTLRFWIRNPSIERKWAAQNAVVEAVKSAFEEEDVKIPYPQRELMGREETEGFRIRTDVGDAGEGGEDPDEEGEDVLGDVNEPVDTRLNPDLEPAIEEVEDPEKHPLVEKDD